MAQDTPFGRQIAASEIPVRVAGMQPTVGEQVVNEFGVVDDAFFLENRICTFRGCRVFIFDKRSGALILNDRVWSEAYAPTERGFEVIRVKAFEAREIPPSEAPSDEALDSAPAIKKVTRPDTERQE